MAEKISLAEFDEKVIKADKPVLVEFFAAWCGPCQMMSPIIEELEKEVKKTAHIYKVDVDSESELANKYSVMSIPTIFIFKKGKIANQFNGVQKKEDLKKALE